MKRSILLSLVVLSGVLAAPAVNAAPAAGHRCCGAPLAVRDPAVNRRQHVQGDRIRQGARSGELTRAETRGLFQQRRGIRQDERLYKSDGVLTRAERRDLHGQLNGLSRDIYAQKHDAERRPRAW
jgi:hypothetical protein